MSQLPYLEHLFPIRSVIITLRFLQPARPHFFHQPRLRSLLHHLLGEEAYPLRPYLLFDTPETGRTCYQTGDLYQFQVYCFEPAAIILQHLLTALNNLPDSAPNLSGKVPFGNNIACSNISDGFTKQPIQSVDMLSIYDIEHLEEETQLWKNHHARLSLQWLSPVQLLKPDGKKNSKHKKFCRDVDDFSFELLLQRYWNTYAHINPHIQAISAEKKQRFPSPKWMQDDSKPFGRITSGHMFWLDHHYEDKDKQQKPVGGALGSLELAIEATLPTEAWQLLVLGQMMGVGQQRNMGWGRYQLVTADGQQTLNRCLAANALLPQLSSPSIIVEAVEHVQKNSQSNTQTDTLLSEHEEFRAYTSHTTTDDVLIEQINDQLKKITQEQYTTPELKGVVIEKKSGGYRPLAIPPFHDRILQRIVAKSLQTGLEQIMYSRSYGYRPGRSRRGAMEAIQLAVRQGYQWVFESDLKDFFDSISYKILAERLQACYGQDPLIPQIMQWMMAPVNYKGETITRHQGIPQGSPLSPLMANLVLDDFDSDMQQAGFKLVRFADDFVVMCRSLKEANQARKRAEQSLQEHGLALNKDKTHIKPMDSGLKFLGYLFVNDMVLDVGSQKNATIKPMIPGNSWLAKISTRANHEISGKEAINSVKALAHPSQDSDSLRVGTRNKYGSIICVSGAIATLATEQGRVQIHRNDELITNTPWQNLQAIVLLGAHHITTPAMRAAMKHGVAIHFSNHMGDYQGCCWNGQAPQGHKLWLQQQQQFTQLPEALAAAKSLVNVRIKQCITVLRNRQLGGIQSLKRLCDELYYATTLAELNGYEGKAAAIYFSHLGHCLPKQWQFKGRNRRPPKDPFNVLLSLGYTLLYGYVNCLIRVQGLLPTVGFYHQGLGTHSALASDLMEPFRHLVERKACSLLRKQQLNTDDFKKEADRCQMTPKAIKYYLAELSRDFEQVNAQGDTLTEQLVRQNRQVFAWIQQGELFNADHIYSDADKTGGA